MWYNSCKKRSIDTIVSIERRTSLGIHYDGPCRECPYHQESTELNTLLNNWFEDITPLPYQTVYCEIYDRDVSADSWECPAPMCW